MDARSRRALGLAALGALAAVVAAAGPGGAAPRKKDPPAPAAGGKVPAGGKLDARALARHIDRVIEQRAKAEKVTLSPKADDSEFLRRAYLDILGRIPSAEQAKAFLDSRGPDKRAKLIDELLAGEDYGKHQADVWQALMLPRNSDNRRFMQFYPNLEKWLAEQFNAGKGWDRIVHDVLTATGPVDRPGPAVYFLANLPVDKVTDNVTKLFLGVQLQCAQCHNHPFTEWKQSEYWGMAAFFMKVRPNGNPRAAVRGGGGLSMVEGPQVVRNRRILPESAKVLPPKFLQGEKAKVNPRQPWRPALADWLTTPENPFFGKAMVNRTWGQFFGRGFVNPVDDMHDANPASHPELLAELAKQFAANGFDVKYLIRAICNSETYQRTSKPAGNNGDAPPELFARVPVKVLTPEQLFDSLTQVVGPPARPALRRGPAGRFALSPRQQFVFFFGVDEGADPLEYQGGIPQVLRLMNAPAFTGPGVLNRVLKDVNPKQPNEAVERLYLTTLSRRPRAAELRKMLDYLRKHEDQPRQAYADILWALLNSSEFTLNH